MKISLFKILHSSTAEYLSSQYTSSTQSDTRASSLMSGALT